MTRKVTFKKSSDFGKISSNSYEIRDLEKFLQIWRKIRRLSSTALFGKLNKFVDKYYRNACLNKPFAVERFFKCASRWVEITLLKKTISCTKSIKYMKLIIKYFVQGSSSTKIIPQAKIDNFAFKNSNIIGEGTIWKRKDYFSWKKFEMQKNNVYNKFYFCRTFSLIASYQILQNYAILINHESLF